MKDEFISHEELKSEINNAPAWQRFLWRLEGRWRYGWRPRHTWYAIRDFIQRGRRGWGDGDVVDLQSYYSGLIAGSIAKMAIDPISMPAELCGDESNNYADSDGGHAKWIVILNEIADGFRAHEEMMNEHHLPDSPEYQALEARWKKGSALFIQWYGALWL